MKRAILIMLMLLFSAALVQAASCPTNPPVTYTGTAKENGVPIDGQTIVAKIGSVTNQGDVDNGQYRVSVSPCFGTNSGTITFSINGLAADIGAPYGGTADWGKLINLNLNFGDFPATPPCPNGVINVGEVCDGSNLGGATCSSVMGSSFLGSISCQANCLDFDTTNCYQTQICEENWTCTDWSACSSGTQTRTCTEQNGCGTADDKPAESQSCSTSDTGSSSSSSSSSGGGGGGGGGGGATPKCNDRKDNDGDKLIDMADPGCSSKSDNDEKNEETVITPPTGERQTVLEGSNQDSYGENTGETGIGVFGVDEDNADNAEAGQNELTGAAIGATVKTTLLYGLLVLGIIAVLLGGALYVKKMRARKKNSLKLKK